jgi:hypothetical protein
VAISELGMNSVKHAFFLNATMTSALVAMTIIDACRPALGHQDLATKARGTAQCRSGGGFRPTCAVTVWWSVRQDRTSKAAAIKPALTGGFLSKVSR